MTEDTDRRRRATLLAVLAAVFVLFVGVATWAGVQAYRSSNPSGNVALSDEALTAEVRTQVGAGLKAVFSYDFANLARTERAAGGALVEEAAAQYRRDFGALKARAAERKIVRTTTVRSLGVESLHDDTAKLLAFLDQQTLYTADGKQESATSVVGVEARKIGGSWKITKLTAL